MNQRIAAIDLGSGTIKLSAFAVGDGVPAIPIELAEANTELRGGMGPDWLLQPGPVAATLSAVEAFVAKARAYGIESVPAYGTSALRKAKNRELLFAPLKERFGITAALLSEEDEGRLNLLGATAVGATHASPGSGGRFDSGIVVMDPGGDSSDCAWGPDWKTAKTASLPFGSVSLQEKFGTEAPGGPIPESAIEGVKTWVKFSLDAYAPAAELKNSKLVPAIRMNAPIASALATFAGRTKQRYELDDLRMLTLGMAAMPHDARAALIAGEPVGKVDRTPFGFASWVGLLEWMNAGSFIIEPYGIKLGAALYLNGLA